MLWTLLSMALPSLAIAMGMIPLTGLMLWWRRHVRQQERKSPLVRDLLRSPGHSLQERIAELEFEIEGILFVMLYMPLLMYAMHVSRSYFGKDPESISRTLSSVAICGIAMAWLGSSLPGKLFARRSHVLGLEGELAVGEELNQLMLDGSRVFHDVPITYGNIDHVVISESGVYSVNTKMRGKPTATTGTAEVIIDHEANLLRFPDGAYPIPTEKLLMEARCLSEKLSSAVGEPVEVEAMLALPGWFIKERIGRGPVFVFNPVKPHRFFLQNRKQLSPVMMQRIAHQIEQLCRDIKPSFREERAWAPAK